MGDDPPLLHLNYVLECVSLSFIVLGDCDDSPKASARPRATKGEFTEVSYMFTRPGADKTPAPKVSIVTRASNDLGCGVGYYK